MIFELPAVLLYTIIFTFGVIVGSFLNVFLLRFHTGKSINGSSHCMSCQSPLRWFDLFPLLSYLGLRGRCRRCGAGITSRYFWVELSAGTLAVVALATTANVYLWPLMSLLAMILVVVTVYDIDHMIIPHEFVASLCIIAVLYLGYGWWSGELLPISIMWHGVAGVGAGLFFYVLWWYSDGRWIGLGDAKLALPLGVLTGPTLVFSLVVLAFWIGTIISLGVMAFRYLKKRGQPHLRFLTTNLTMKSEVPFAPFLVLAFICTFWLGVNVLDWFSYVV